MNDQIREEMGQDSRAGPQPVRVGSTASWAGALSTAILFSLWNGFSDGWDGFLFKLIPALVLFPLGGIAVGPLHVVVFGADARPRGERVRLMRARLRPRAFGGLAAESPGAKWSW